ncbi:MAG: tetratricopeptide repeat protein, partial [Planctomycetota bacterium]
AHAQSVVHRYLSLASIRVGAFGEVYVTSWDQAEKANSEQQIQEDIPALGKILLDCYRVLCSFQNKRHGKASRSRRTNASLPKEFTEFPPDIQAIICKSIHRDWKQRYTSVQAFSEDILRYTKNLRLSIRNYGLRELIGKWIRRNKRKFFGLFFLIVLISFFSGYGIWSFYQDRQKQLTELWLQLQEEKKQAFSADTPQSIEKTVHHLLVSLNLCNVMFTLTPQEALVAQEKWALGKNLITLTCAQENYPLAYSVFQDLESLSAIKDSEKKLLRDYIFTEKRKFLTQHLQQLEEWLQKLKSHFREDNLRDEAILELSRLKEPEIAERLLFLLKEGTQYFLQQKNRTSAQEEFYGVIPCILGRMSQPQIPQALWDSLELLYQKISVLPETKRPSSEIHYMVLLTQSLSYTQAQKFLLPLFLMRYRMGIESIFSRKTEHTYEKLIHLDYLKQLPLKDSESLTYRGTLLLSKNDYAGALADFNEAIRLDPQNKTAYNNLGLDQFHSKDFEGALSVFHKLLELDPKDSVLYQNRGNIFYEMGNWAAAIEDWNQMIQLSPEDPKGYSNRGNARRKSGDLAGALDDYTHAITLNPRLPEIYANRGIVKKERGDLTGAMSDYNQAISLQTQEATIFMNRGILKLEMNDLEGALLDFSQAIRLNPTESLFYYHRGLAKKQQGQKKQALEDFSQSIKLNPDYRHSYFLRGEMNLEEGDLNEASKDFERLIQMDPSYASAYLKRGLLYSFKKRYKESIEDYTKAIQLDPKMTEAYHNRAISLITGKQFEEAMNDLNQALQINPNNSVSYFTRGQLNSILKDFVRAKSDFQEYLEQTKDLQDGQTRNHRRWIEQQFPELKK